jgi:phosphoribosylformylglycinamidine synthase
MSGEVKVLVQTGYAVNCQDESRYAANLAATLAKLNGRVIAEQVQINKLLPARKPEEIGIFGTKKLEDYHIWIIPGGFSGGDQLGAGVFLARKMELLREVINNFIKQGKLVIGICNGFQVMVNYGLLPGFEGNYNQQLVDLMNNDCGNFQNRWVKLKVNPKSPCVFTKGIEYIDLPIRHGEGKFWAPPEVIERIVENEQVAVQYVMRDDAEKLARKKFPDNPNGSLLDIAGICDPTGNIFGLMPHPEAYNDWTNHPQWTHYKEQLKRNGKNYPKEGAGIKIFQNAIEYVLEELM